MGNALLELQPPQQHEDKPIHNHWSAPSCNGSPPATVPALDFPFSNMEFSEADALYASGDVETQRAADVSSLTHYDVMNAELALGYGAVFSVGGGSALRAMIAKRYAEIRAREQAAIALAKRNAKAERAVLAQEVKTERAARRLERHAAATAKAEQAAARVEQERLLWLQYPPVHAVLTAHADKIGETARRVRDISAALEQESSRVLLAWHLANDDVLWKRLSERLAELRSATRKAHQASNAVRKEHAKAHGRINRLENGSRIGPKDFTAAEEAVTGDIGKAELSRAAEALRKAEIAAMALQ